MASYTQREIVTRRIEYIVPTPPPWGACVGDMQAALFAAQEHWRRAHGKPGDLRLPDDALRFTPQDDEIVISFTIEEVSQ